MNNNKNGTLSKLIQINNSLDEINIFNDFKSYEPNDEYKENICPVINSNIIISNNNDKDKNKEKLRKTNNSEYDSPLLEIIKINKGIDSVYDNMQRMKSNNKINSKVLYLISHSSQTLEEY